MIALALALQLAVGEASGSVAGRVLGPGDQPVAGARLSIEALERATTSGPEGRWRLAALPDGRWTIEVRADGFLERGVVVSVAHGATVSLDFELEPRPGAAVPAGTVAGVVLEEGRLEPIHFALVEVFPLGNRVLTDEDGLFSIGGVPSGAWTVRVSAPGYVPRERALPLDGSMRRLELRLEPSPLPLVELIVRGTPGGARVLAREPEARVVDSALASLMPSVVERDVLRGAQILPSVTPASDFNAAPYVRGGTLGQTPVVLDGVPLHNPFHVGGFVSAFEPSAVDATVLRPGGLPASAASGLSGLLEVHTRDGGRDSVRVAGGASLLSSALTASGPWRRGSWLLSGRRTYIDLGSAMMRGVGLTDADWPYRFWDLLGKVTTDLGGRGRSLTVSTYLDREGFHDGSSYRATWGSDAVSARFRGLVSGGITLEAGVGTSGFGADFRRSESADSVAAGTVSDLDASVRTWLAGASVEGGAGGQLLSAGVHIARSDASQTLDPRGDLTGLFTPGATAGSYGTTALFVRDRWRPVERVTVDGGVRLEKAAGRAWVPLPRGRVEVALGRSSSLALSAGTYLQDWWSLRNEESVAASVVAYDVTVPVPRGKPLPGAWDLVLEGRTELGGWSLRADAYRKRLRDTPVSPVAARPSHTPVTLSPDSVRLGGQHVDGLELFATGSLFGAPTAISYRVQRERSLLDGDVFVPRLARTHRVVVSTRRSWGTREVALGLTWMSGRPYTPPAAVLPAWGEPDGDGRAGPSPYGRPPILLGEPNAARMPTYLRLDLDFRGAWGLTLFGRRGAMEPYLSVLNVFNGNNALWVTPQVRDGILQLEVGPQLPLLPTFGVRWRF